MRHTKRSGASGRMHHARSARYLDVASIQAPTRCQANAPSEERDYGERYSTCMRVSGSRPTVRHGRCKPVLTSCARLVSSRSGRWRLLFDKPDHRLDGAFGFGMLWLSLDERMWHALETNQLDMAAGRSV